MTGGLRPLQVIDVPGTGCEDVLVADDGSVYTGTADGSVVAVRPDGRRITRIGHTGGRPLGLEHLPDGRILVCDAHRGLLALDPRDGGIESLVTTVAGRWMRFCNNAAVTRDGDIWFTDSSLVYGVEEWRKDFVEDTRTGRLMVRRASGLVEVVLDRIPFANGVALAADESFVLVTSTGAAALIRRWLSGPRVGTTEVFRDDLPGYPDNIARGSDGLIWVTIASPRDPVVDAVRRGPLAVRRQVTRIPMALQPQPRRTARVQAYDAEGALVHDLDCDAERFHMATGVREHQGAVWMGSLLAASIARVDVG